MNGYFNRITVNPRVMFGKPVIKGTRIPVELILKKLGQNMHVEAILVDYPRLTREDIMTLCSYRNG